MSIILKQAKKHDITAAFMEKADAVTITDGVIHLCHSWYTVNICATVRKGAWRNPLQDSVILTQPKVAVVL
jgi:hypothetical protein